MILLLDNYDSFTYNLYQYLGELHDDIRVIRNDQIDVEKIEALRPDGIVFSPGSGVPSKAGHMEAIIKKYYTTIPMLGICLGHQAIGEVFGGCVKPAKEKKHGETSTITIMHPSILFASLSSTIEVGRYHSLIVEDIGSDIVITAKSDTDEIMAMEHKSYPVYGVQFHPESILTPCGKTILKNFVACLNN